jgi:hypothetical protein
VIRPTFHGELLGGAQLAAYQRALVHSHQVACRVELLNSDEKVRAEILQATDRFDLGVTGGQVDVDATQKDQPTRSATVTILDPKRKLHLEPDNAADWGIFAGDMLRIWRGDYVDELGGWAWCPVITGPISGFTRDHPECTITVVGKEALALDPYVTLSAVTANRGTRFTTAIKRVLEYTGERRYQFPELGSTLTHHLNVPRLSQGWVVAQHLADVADRQLFYDGRGYLRLRAQSINPIYTFKTGGGGALLQAPALTYDFTSFRNTADISGGKPKKAKHKVHVIETVSPPNPLSPGALARNDAPKHAVIAIDNAQILRTAKAVELGKRAIGGSLVLSTDPSQSTFDSLPIPHLEEFDLVTVATDQGHIQIRMKQWTVPLDSDSMPVGVRRLMRWRTRYRVTRRGRRHK